MENLMMKKVVYVAVIILTAANIFVWQTIAAEIEHKNLGLYFLDVGQGDSELIDLPGGVQMVIDGGPDAKVLNSLGKVLLPTDRYIDLLVVTHPQLDHFGGLIDVLKNYKVGAVLDNGRKGTIAAYGEFEKALAENGARHVVLKEGDRIIYNESVFDVLSPDKASLASKELNDTCLVLMLRSGNLRALYTGDIGANIEDELIRKYDLSAQILKVGHHGSKFSSDSAFLKEVDPVVSVIEVGAKNTYGHPTKQALGRLANIGSQVFRTDQSGNVKIEFDGRSLKIFD